ncbi:TetR/AcrR family transcriptional regulator [uncultured Desulfobacter sp.]|uniref:TetR/AcrR family transcriptional regulator n=1 Tax=uncultured Desulfobacter sp. TaxID=240139 RepID=UPI0029F4E4FA|nr:TetR/AcrR family transcriptional regulator [uncultured Desulfobacter sp.]
MAEAGIREHKKDQSVRKILKAALLVFSTQGFNGARIDTIARKAGVNKAMIYYRIGNKQALYQAVIQDIYQDRAVQLRREIQSSTTPEEKLDTYIASVATIMDAHPHFTRIMIREMVSGWTNFGPAIFEEVSVTVKIVQAILDEGVEKGVFTKTDPLAVHTMVLGALILNHLTQPVKPQIMAALNTSEAPSDISGFNKLVPQVQRLVVAALRPEAYPRKLQDVS